ncbi:MAG: RDD family protein [Pirellulales bacterium]
MNLNFYRCGGCKLTAVLDWSILGDPSELQMEFRCNRCWHSNYVTADHSGTQSECSHCHAVVEVPEVTEERLQRALDHLARAAEGIAAEDSVATSAGIGFDAENPYAAQSNAIRLNAYEGFATAGLWSRLFASIIDGAAIAVSIVAGFVALYYASLNGVTAQVRPIDEMSRQQLSLLFGPVCALQLLQWVLLSVRGQSIGKFMCLIRVVTLSGRRAGFFRAVLIRDVTSNIFRSVIPFFGLIDVLFIFGASHRCVHDYMAGTKVVNTY